LTAARGHGRWQITREDHLAEMRDSGARGILVCSLDYRCSHLMALMADHWPGDGEVSDVRPRFLNSVCGKHGAAARPNFNWDIKGPFGGMGYR
jgi:hypothetical protein